MTKCSQQLTTNQAGRLKDRLVLSDFSYDLYDYYQGVKAKWPELKGLVDEINDQEIPTYFKETFAPRDRVDFLNDAVNVNRLNGAIGEMIAIRAQSNPQNLENPTYAINPNEILTALRADAAARLGDELKDQQEQAEKENIVDSPTADIVSTNEDNYPAFKRKYDNLGVYRRLRFMGSATTETLMIGKFVNDVLIRSAFINTDTKTVVDQRQSPRQPGEIDQNLKSYRKQLLTDLIKRLNVNTVEEGKSVAIDPIKALHADGFEDALTRIEKSVMNVNYRGEQVNLANEGVLVEIANELKKSKGDPALKSIVDNYTDYVILSDFDKLFSYYTNDAIHVNDYNSNFDESSRKYSVEKVNSVDALNINWTDKVHNGVELASSFYKTLISYTPLLSFTTGEKLSEFLYPTLVSEVLSPYYDQIDRQKGARDVKNIIIKALSDRNLGQDQKDTLYTLYKNFFEEQGDKLQLHKKNKNRTVSSFLDTLSDNQGHKLMLTIVKPIQEIAKVYFAEAGEENKEATIRQVGSRLNTTARTNVRNELVTNVNKSIEDIDKLITKYNIDFVNGRESKISYGLTPNQMFDLTATGATTYDMGVITDLSKDLFGIDFIDNNAHAEFLAELQTRAQGDDEKVYSPYLVMLHDGLRVLEARKLLKDPDLKSMLKKQGIDATVSNELINSAIKNSTITADTPLESVTFPLGAAAENIYDILAVAENRYAGNRVNHTHRTLEGTQVAAFGTTTYYVALHQNHAKVRRQLDSVRTGDDSRVALRKNIFIEDAALLKRFAIKSATKIGNTVKSNAEMTDLESLHFNINLGYFDTIGKALRTNTEILPMFDPTTYSDKTTNYMAVVRNTYNGQSLFVRDGVAVDEKVTKDLHFDSMQQYYRAHANNAMDTWRAIFSAISPSAEQTFDLNVSAKMAPSKKMEAINALVADLGKSKIFPNSDHLEHGLTGLEAARHYAAKAGVELTNWIHYNNNGKSMDNDRIPLGAKPELIKYMSLFDDSGKRTDYNNFMEKKMIESANEMHKLGFKFDSVASRTIAQLYPSLDVKFHSDNGMVLFRGTKAEKASEIHPAFRKHFYDFNLISENLMNSSLGSPFAHKGDSPFKAWVTQVKRNVAATASIRNYTLGLERGVENATTTAVIDDFETGLQTILGDKPKVVDMDGASLETMTQRIKTWESLNSEFGGDGGPDHKSFLSDYDPRTGTFRQLKHAAFAMDYNMIRNSIGSEVDLMELHKKLYKEDLSKVDVTRSWKDSVNLAYPKDLYYWDRAYDFNTDVAGSIWKIEAIRHKGFDDVGNSMYEVQKRNLTQDLNNIITVPAQINTMFELWSLLGHINSVEPTDDSTNISYHDGQKNIYFKPSHTSAERLVDHEAYMGDKNEYMIPAEYIRAKTTPIANGWKVYQSLFGSDGVVNSHIALVRKYASQDPASFDVQSKLQQELYGVDSKMNSAKFLELMHANANDLEALFTSVIDNSKGKSKGRISFGSDEVKYQRYKGKNIDRLSFIGAVKVGQVNMNSTSVLSRSKLLELETKNPKLVGQELPGIHSLITYPFSNFNCGIQLNAFHEAEESTVTAPTQMLNALSFNGKNIEDVTKVYTAIGNLVDAELTMALSNPELGSGSRQANIPQLVSGLSNTDFYTKNKDTLLQVFHKLIQEKVERKEDFTLQGEIIRAFTHANLPIDDAHMFSSAVAELSNYFTKNGIRINFDGIFSVLAPSSRMMQFHDVIGGALPIKAGNGALTYRPLDPVKVTTLNRSDFELWKSYGAHLAANPDKIPEGFTAGTTVDEQPRDLRGQRVILKHANGTYTPLSVLRDNEEHLIPEAIALTRVNAQIDTAKDYITTKFEGYAQLTPEEHAQHMQDSWDIFKNDFYHEMKKDAHIQHVFNDFANQMRKLNPNLPDSNVLDAIYNAFNMNKTFRDTLNAKYEKSGDTRNLRLSREYEYLDKLNQVNKMFTSQLQKFLDDASTGAIPASLKNKKLFDGSKLEGSTIVTSRGEAIAPLTAKAAFLLKEGDSFSDVDEHLFYKRLDEQLSYLNVDADAVMISKNGRKVFVHNEKQPKGTVESANLRVIDGEKWYTDTTGNQLFQVPKGVFIANVGGELHAYLNNKFDIFKSNPLSKSLNAAFKDQHEAFSVRPLGGTTEEKAQRLVAARADIANRAKAMHNSWLKWLDVIGTRIPGQHFQSFQGMTIVGFTEGNKVYVPNEVTLLSGSDFDIDKQNIIYNSLNDNGTLALWHPAARYDTVENVEKSLQLPLQEKRNVEAFSTTKDVTGASVQPEMVGQDGQPIDDNMDLRDLDNLLYVYGQLDKGFRLDAKKNPRLLEILTEYDNHTRGKFVMPEESENNDPFANDIQGLNNGVKGIKNFAVAKTNKTIENPANFIYLSKPVSMDVPALFANNSLKGEQAKMADPHKQNSITNQKEANMVGKKVIGIMATALKAWSAVSVTYHNELIKSSTLVNELSRLQKVIEGLDPITQKGIVDQVKIQSGEIQKQLNSSFNALRLDKLPISNALLGDLGRSLDLIPNMNYDKISSEVLHKFFDYAAKTGEGKAELREMLEKVDPLVFKDFIKTRGKFEEDAAEILSQLLSAATDNAKELILAKINANPDLAGMYASMIMLGVPFEQIVTKMTSPVMEMIIKRGSTNVFDKATSTRSIKNLIDTMVAYYDPGTSQKRVAKLSAMLAKDYEGIVPAEKAGVKGFQDISTKEFFPVDEVNVLQKIQGVSNEVSLLGRMLSINQGVKSNSWDLHRYRMQIEDHVNKKLPGVDFKFKTFLDSLDSNGAYHKHMIDLLSDNREGFNILHVLASNPHFAKQLTAYNSAATMLGISSYKVNTADRMVEKLRSMNFLTANQDVNKEQYGDIEKFIENTVIENFISEEYQNNTNPHSRPVFYHGDQVLTLNTPHEQQEFANWVESVFLPNIKDQPNLRGNEFIQGLTVAKKRDALLNDDFNFIKLKLDTTNVKSQIQEGNREFYTYNLGLLYHRNATDLQHEDPIKQNDIVNTLFWYNLILNKNNITKFSYARLLGDVMGLNETKDNPYRRLLELKGNIGKTDMLSGNQETNSLLTSNGVTFDIFDLFNYENFLSEPVKWSGVQRENEYNWDEGQSEGRESEDDFVDYSSDDGEYNETAAENYDENGQLDMSDSYDEGDATTPNRPKMTVTKYRQVGTPGTTIVVKVGDNELIRKTIAVPGSLIPHNSQGRGKYTFYNEFNPLKSAKDAITDTDSINYQKMMNMSMHDFLRNIAGKLEVKIIQKGGDPEGELFDPTKHYEC